MKLLLLGAEPDDEDAEAQPLRIPGVEKIISSKEIRQYYTPELFHYLDFFHQCKRFGLPFANFLEAPWWVLQLQSAFEQVYSEIEAYQIQKIRNVPRRRMTTKPTFDDSGVF